MSRYRRLSGTIILLFFLSAGNLGLLAQERLLLTGRLGYGYFGNNPFVTDVNRWSLNQGFIALDLSGYLLDPRLITFSLSGNYSKTGYSRQLEGSDYGNAGYQLQLNFLPRRNFNFGLRYGKNKIMFQQAIVPGANPTSFSTHFTNKEFYINLFRVKFLPNIRVNYFDHSYFSEINEDNISAEKRLEVSAVKSAGKSHFDLNYRLENRENDFLAFDTTHQNVRVIERVNFNPDSSLYINGVYNNYSVKLPNDESLGSDSAGLSLHYSRRFSKNIQASVRYNYALRSGDRYASHSHSAGLRANVNVTSNIVVSPEVAFFTDRLSLDEGEENISEPSLGLRLSYQDEIFKMRFNSIVGLYYRAQTNDVRGDMNDFSQFFSVSLGAGHMRSVLGTLSYTYSKVDLDMDNTFMENASFFEGIGRKQDSNLLRLELRSGAIRLVHIYLYSQYNRFKREYSVEGISDAQTFDNGVTVNFNGISLSANYGTSRFSFGETRADFDSFSYILNIRFHNGLDFRAQSTKRTRTDVFFLGDYEWVQEVYLRYNVGKFFLSAVYRKRKAIIQGFDRQDEGISLRVSRSLGVLFRR